ncbi:MAG: FAD-dependent oxidoreductase [Flavobacteriaceae bacterium]|nr:FAD-dependent oxidoreductase [Flavobacteriaceae bacterium]
MKKSDYKIHIVGAGVSGLIAAQVLENYGYHPIIIESTDSVGGRVKSDIIEGYILDHGFQVLLSSYPAAKKYLDYTKLNLQEFLEGATIFKKGKSETIGDPLRNLHFLLPTMFASIGSVADKVKILNLNNRLKKKSIEAIFKDEEKTTLLYLKDFGFSNDIINNFFKPFFSGIFLEPDLSTSSRMFEFIYKMFGDGLAMIPKKGMQAIPNQLKDNLKNTTFLFNTTVEEVLDNEIKTVKGKTIKSHMTIIASEASSLISNLKNQETNWKSCDTLYFETDTRIINKPIIGLIAEDNALINSIFYPTSIATSTKGNKELLSVTIVKPHNLSKDQLIEKVQQELNEHCKIKNTRFLKRYVIKKALPHLTNIQYEISNTETKLKPTIFLAGDQLLNGSLNAAMIAGERAALGVIKALEDGLIVDELTSEHK